MNEYRRVRWVDERDWKKKDRKKRDRDFRESDPTLPVNIDPQAITTTIPPVLITEALRYRLGLVGVAPELVSRANVYENAINKLLELLETKPLDPVLRTSANDELNQLTNILYSLFSGQVRLKSRGGVYESGCDLSFEGYVESLEKDVSRVDIYQRTTPIFSPIVSRVVTPACQIRFNDIIGRSSRGGVIADGDSGVRCGLSYKPLRTEFGWYISIDSGECSSAGGEKQWRVIRPLSQAINLTSGSKGYTFHHRDIPSQTYLDQGSYRQFMEFNIALSTIFRRMSH